jgi:hypothetical protein
LVVKGPRDIACPTAPLGWFIPVHNGKRTEGGIVGVQYETVYCNYFTRDRKHIVVNSTFALPDDPNPINDFYYGCGSGATQWNNRNRMFQIVGNDRWVAAAFEDLGRTLNRHQVSSFELITRELLNSSAPSAHTCALKLAPEPVT